MFLTVVYTVMFCHVHVVTVKWPERLVDNHETGQGKLIYEGHFMQKNIKITQLIII